MKLIKNTHPSRYEANTNIRYIVIDDDGKHHGYDDLGSALKKFLTGPMWSTTDDRELAPAHGGEDCET